MKQILSTFLCMVLLLGLSCTALADEERSFVYEEEMAQVLKNLGLFQGRAEDDFALEDRATREEALTMLVRLLGKEDEAKNGTWTHPFDDVSPWAQSYVGYAYQNGLTNGISATKFGGGKNYVTAEMYLTYVLRAMHISDDRFDWRNPYAAAFLCGAFPNGVNIRDFRRADMVAVSYAALVTNETRDALISDDEWVELCALEPPFEEMLANAKRHVTGIGEYLIDENVITIDALRAEYRPELLSGYETAGCPDSRELSQCGGTFTFKATYEDGSSSYGTGFFVDDEGTALTRFQNIAGAVEGVVHLSERLPKILGVYAYDVQEDWALLKVDVSGTDYYTVAPSYVPENAEHVFSTYPDGWGKTQISGGVITDNAKTVNGAPRYENNADTVNGEYSFPGGGALLNAQGNAIGITLNRTYAELDEWKRSDAVPLSCVDFAAKDGAYQTLPEVTAEVGLRVTTLERMQQWAEMASNDTEGQGIYGYQKYYDDYELLLLPHGFGEEESDNFIGMVFYYGDTDMEFLDVTQYLNSDVIDVSLAVYSYASEQPQITAVLSIPAQDIAVNDNLFYFPNDTDVTVEIAGIPANEITQEIRDSILLNMSYLLDVLLSNYISLLDGNIGGHDLTDLGFCFDGLTLGE